MDQPDPHDQLLLTERPTTIVTQHTAAHDSMPSPYGSQEDEEALFSQVGDDAGFAQNAAASINTRSQTEDRVPAVMREGPGPGAISIIPAGMDGKTVAILAGLGLGIAYLLTRK